jgi:hypothetical protein
LNTDEMRVFNAKIPSQTLHQGSPRESVSLLP